MKPSYVTLRLIVYTIFFTATSLLRHFFSSARWSEYLFTWIYHYTYTHRSIYRPSHKRLRDPIPTRQAFDPPLICPGTTTSLRHQQRSQTYLNLSPLTTPAHPPSFSSPSRFRNPRSSLPRSRGHEGVPVTYSNHFSCPLASCSRSSTTSPLHPPVCISRRTFPTSLPWTSASTMSPLRSKEWTATQSIKSGSYATTSGISRHKFGRMPLVPSCLETACFLDVPSCCVLMLCAIITVVLIGLCLISTSERIHAIIPQLGRLGILLLYYTSI